MTMMCGRGSWPRTDVIPIVVGEGAGGRARVRMSAPRPRTACCQECSLDAAPWAEGAGRSELGGLELLVGRFEGCEFLFQLVIPEDFERLVVLA